MLNVAFSFLVSPSIGLAKIVNVALSHFSRVSQVSSSIPGFRIGMKTAGSEIRSWGLFPNLQTFNNRYGLALPARKLIFVPNESTSADD